MSEENKMEPAENTVSEAVEPQVLEISVTEEAVAEAPVSEEAVAEACVKDTPTEGTPTPPSYQWSYRDQRDFDMKKRGKERRRGLLLYAAVMTVAFLVCFGILLGTVVWYGGGKDVWYGDQPLSAVEIFDYVAPATVFIQSYRSTTLLGEGTGFFVRSDGYIATNYHVIEKATQIKIYLNTGTTYIASVIGYDQANDLAVLKIDGDHFPVPVIGNSDELRIGEPAIVIGHPSGAGGAWSITEGIVSALNRKVTSTEGSSSARPLTVIQIDAAVNPGNSGGPLCNTYGEIVGIVTLKNKDHEAMGYAIPINHAMTVINAIIDS